MLFFFNDTATTEIYTLSLHDALPIFQRGDIEPAVRLFALSNEFGAIGNQAIRSEEHTSELQSRSDLVCRLLLEKKNWGLSIRAAILWRRFSRPVPRGSPVTYTF